MNPTKEDLRISTTSNVFPQYVGSGDPALKDYYPAWVNNMADDATVEGSMLDGVVEGADAVRSVVLVRHSVGSSDLMEFVRFGSGNALRHERRGQRPKMLRLVVSMAQLLAPYGHQGALGIATDLDTKIETLLQAAA